jgi:hypothetical protein
MEVTGQDLDQEDPLTIIITTVLLEATGLPLQEHTSHHHLLLQGIITTDSIIRSTHQLRLLQLLHQLPTGTTYHLSLLCIRHTLHQSMCP